MKDLLLIAAIIFIAWMLLFKGDSSSFPNIPSILQRMSAESGDQGQVLPSFHAPTKQQNQIQSQPQDQLQPTPVIRAYSTPAIPPTPDQALGSGGGYFVVNGYRLYCDLITPDLQYTGDEIMKEWWDTLSPELKRIQKSMC